MTDGWFLWQDVLPITIFQTQKRLFDVENLIVWF